MEYINTLLSTNYLDLIKEIRYLHNYQIKIVELRLDYYQDDYQEAIDYLKNKNYQVLITNRFEGEDNIFDNKYWDIYVKLNNYDYVDIELSRVNFQVKEKIKLLMKKAKIIASYHYYGTFEQLKWDWIFKIKERWPQALFKIAIKVERKADLLEIEKISKYFDITIGMGILGQETRIKAQKYHNDYMFIATITKKKTGQLPVSFYENLRS